jgi:hypothetical protein
MENASESPDDDMSWMDRRSDESSGYLVEHIHDGNKQLRTVIDESVFEVNSERPDAVDDQGVYIPCPTRNQAVSTSGGSKLLILLDRIRRYVASVAHLGVRALSKSRPSVLCGLVKASRLRARSACKVHASTIASYRTCERLTEQEVVTVVADGSVPEPRRMRGEADLTCVPVRVD